MNTYYIYTFVYSFTMTREEAADSHALLVVQKRALVPRAPAERDFFIDNLLVWVHFIIAMITYVYVKTVYVSTTHVYVKTVYVFSGVHFIYMRASAPCRAKTGTCPAHTCTHHTYISRQYRIFHDSHVYVKTVTYMSRHYTCFSGTRTIHILPYIQLDICERTYLRRICRVAVTREEVAHGHALFFVQEHTNIHITYRNYVYIYIYIYTCTYI